MQRKNDARCRGPVGEMAKSPLSHIDPHTRPPGSQIPYPYPKLDASEVEKVAIDDTTIIRLLRYGWGMSSVGIRLAALESPAWKRSTLTRPLVALYPPFTGFGSILWSVGDTRARLYGSYRGV